MGEEGEGRPAIVLEGFSKETKLDLALAIHSEMFPEFWYLNVVGKNFFLASPPFSIPVLPDWMSLQAIPGCGLTESHSLLKVEN